MVYDGDVIVMLFYFLFLLKKYMFSTYPTMYFFHMR